MAEVDDLRWRLEEMRRDKGALLTQLNQRNGELIAARAKADRLAEILLGIHSLLFPPITEVGGKAFRFKPDDAADYMQALSDRIRAIPEEIGKAQEGTIDG